MPYPVTPGTRLAYDLDGSAVVISSYLTGVLSVLDVAPAAVAAMNDDRAGALCSQNNWDYFNPETQDTLSKKFICVLFPTPTKVTGFYAPLVLREGRYSSLFTVAANLWGSTNSTNGIDGDWFLISNPATFIAPAYRSFSYVDYAHAISGVSPQILHTGLPNSDGDIYYHLIPTNDNYRRSGESSAGIYPVAGALTRNLRAVKITYSAPALTQQNGITLRNTAIKLHLYGEPDTEALADRLDFWQTAQDLRTPAGWMDWGDTPQGSTATKSFRIKNLSTSKTASAITLSALAGLSTTFPTPESMLLFSLDGGASWSSSVVIPALTSGAVSTEIKVRRTTPSTATLSNWSPRITAEVGSWA